MAHPATEKRGGNPDVKQKPEREKPKDAMERKLEQGLEESMTGSDPVSVTQPPKNKHDGVAATLFSRRMGHLVSG